MNNSTSPSLGSMNPQKAESTVDAGDVIQINIIVEPRGQIVMGQFQFRPYQLQGVVGSDRIFMLKKNMDVKGPGENLTKNDIERLRKVMTVRTAADSRNNLSLMEKVTEANLAEIWFPIGKILQTPSNPFVIERLGNTSKISENTFLVNVYFGQTKVISTEKDKCSRFDAECCDEKWSNIETLTAGLLKILKYRGQGTALTPGKVEKVDCYLYLRKNNIDGQKAYNRWMKQFASNPKNEMKAIQIQKCFGEIYPGYRPKTKKEQEQPSLKSKIETIQRGPAPEIG